MSERLPIVTASIPRWASRLVRRLTAPEGGTVACEPVVADAVFVRVARYHLALAKRRRLIPRFSGQIVIAWGPHRADNRLTSPESRAVRHHLIVLLNAEGFSDTEIGLLLGIDRRSVSYRLDLPAPRRTA